MAARSDGEGGDDPRDALVGASASKLEVHMVTTVGTENTLEDLLTDLVKLDYDAADAYRSAIDRLQNPEFRATLALFREDHLRHVDELDGILKTSGKTPPQEGDVKSYLTQGKVVVGGLMGDKAIIQAMKTNEDDTNTAYDRAVAFKAVPQDTHQIFARAQLDERRHRDWMEAALARL